MARSAPPQTLRDVVDLAMLRHRHPINRDTWPWKWNEPCSTHRLRLVVSVRIEPEALYHFEVLRRRLGQSRAEAVREAIGSATVRMTTSAARLRHAEFRELQRLSEDDPLLENFIAQQASS